MTQKESRDKVLTYLRQEGIGNPKGIKNANIVAFQFPMICNVNLDFVKAGGGAVDVCVYAFGAGMGMIDKFKGCFESWNSAHAIAKWWGSNLENSEKRSCVVIKFRSRVKWGNITDADCAELAVFVGDVCEQIRGLGLSVSKPVSVARTVKKVSNHDLDCLLSELAPIASEANRFNIFNVLNVSRTEIRHSNMLAWLLDANQDHGFEGAILADVLKRIGDDKVYDFKSFRVFREWHHIDILLVSSSENLVVAIENKVGACEGVRKTRGVDSAESQLVTYCREIDRMYGKYNRHLIFLTPDGQPPTDSRWGVVTYSDLLQSLKRHYDRVYGGLVQGPEFFEKKALIKNYLETVERNVLMKIDDKLKERCRRIYNEHRDSLEFVMQHGKLNYIEEMEILLKGENCLALGVCDADRNTFRLKVLDSMFPAQPNSGAWWRNSPYICYLNVDDRRRQICCCMGLAPVRDAATMQSEKKMLSLLGDKAIEEDAGWMVVPWRSRGGARNLNNWHGFEDDDTSEDTTFIGAAMKALGEFVAWAQEIVPKVRQSV